MRIKVQSQGRPSAWSRQKEIVEDDTIKKIEDDEGDNVSDPSLIDVAED